MTGGTVNNLDDKTLHPNQIDQQVGRRLKFIRLRRGLTQKQVADEIGISFQQIQKYEQGMNRISASRLWQFSHIMEVDISDFFTEAGRELAEEPPRDARAYKVAAALDSIDNVVVKKHLMDMIQSCARSVKSTS